MEQSQAAEGLTRRQLLAGTAAAGVAAVGLAGCAAGSGAATASTPGATLARAADIAVGGAVVVGGSGQPVVVAQPTRGSFVAHTAICTHGGCTVAVERGMTLQCPCHGSVFDAATGAVEQGPAPRPLAAIAVTVKGGQVVRG